jgi:hypothetical protein
LDVDGFHSFHLHIFHFPSPFLGSSDLFCGHFLAGVFWPDQGDEREEDALKVDQLLTHLRESFLGLMASAPGLCRSLE